MGTTLASPPDGPVLWEAEVIGAYDFEAGRIGDRCRVMAQTAFAALRQAEPLLGVAKEHLVVRIVSDEIAQETKTPRPARARARR